MRPGAAVGERKGIHRCSASEVPAGSGFAGGECLADSGEAGGVVWPIRACGSECPNLLHRRGG
eukprot:10197497-Lingulodinium_polyedra.AAC.1